MERNNKFHVCKYIDFQSSNQIVTRYLALKDVDTLQSAISQRAVFGKKWICQDIVDTALCCIFFHRSFTKKTGLEAVLKRSSPEAVEEYIDLVDEYINLVDECNDNKRLWV